MNHKKTSTRKRKGAKYQQQPRKGKGILRWMIAIVILIILFVFLSGNRSLIKLYSLHFEKNKLEEQKDNLLHQQKELETEIDRLKNDPEYMEKVAREKYNMKKENEEVHIIESK